MIPRAQDNPHHCKSCGVVMTTSDPDADTLGCYCRACLSKIAKASLKWRARLFGDKR